MQECGVPVLARLEELWIQDIGRILEGSFTDNFIQLEQQSNEWSEKAARANRVSSFMNTSFPSTLATEEQLNQRAQIYSIEEPIFRMEEGPYSELHSPW